MLRFARFVPFAFIAGQHGFMLFAPYLAVCLAVLHVARERRLARRALAPLSGLPA